MNDYGAMAFFVRAGCGDVMPVVVVVVMGEAAQNGSALEQRYIAISCKI